MRTISKYIHRLALLIALFAICGEVVGQTQTDYEIGIDSEIGKTKVSKDIPRKALVGPDCLVNTMATILSVGEGIADLRNVLDEDLSNVATVRSLAEVKLIEDPFVIRVKDRKHVYETGTSAGFCIQSSKEGLLSLKVLEIVHIGFYKQDKLVKTEAISAGSGLLKLSLIQLGGEDDAVTYLEVKEAPCDFDEIAIMVGGVDLGLFSSLKIKYAYVGKAKETLLINSKVSNLKYDVSKTLIFNIPLIQDAENLVDDDLDNHATTAAVIVDMGGDITLEWAETFKAGSEVGFYVGQNIIADIPFGTDYISVRDLSGNWHETKLSRGLIKVEAFTFLKSNISITASVDFNAVRYHMGKGVAASGTEIYYGYVNEVPDVPSETPIEGLGMNSSICGLKTQYQLSPSTGVTWTLEKITSDKAGDDPVEGSGEEIKKVKIDANGLVTNMTSDFEGYYHFMATRTNADGSTSVGWLILQHGVQASGSCNEPVTTSDGYESAPARDPEGGIMILNNVVNRENVADEDPNNYAEIKPGISLLSGDFVVGVHKKEGLISNGNDRRIGFLVDIPSNFLNADVLQFFYIKLYNDGKPVGADTYTVEDWNVISAGLIGSEDASKSRLGVTIPSDIEFDEFSLWTGGVLSISLSSMRIYSAFVEDEDMNCDNPLQGCDDAVIVGGDALGGASINYDRTYIGSSLANAGVAMTGLENLLSGEFDPNKYVDAYSTVSLAGSMSISVKFGRALNSNQQVGFVVDKNTFLGNVELIGVTQIKSYYEGDLVETKSDWSVLGADLIGYGDYAYLIFRPTKDEPYDEIQFLTAAAAGVLKSTKIYSIFVRDDADGDGIPNCMDPEPCQGDLSSLEISSDICEGDEVTLSGISNIPEKERSYKVEVKDEMDELVYSLESFTVAKGPFSLSFVLNESGHYTVTLTPIVADGDQTTDREPISWPLLTVHPKETTWKGSASSNWNEWGNWSDGAPWTCTNVIIPTSAATYPELVSGDFNPCNYIHFEPHAEVVNTPYLTYQKAWVEIDLQPDRFYMVSAPLKNIFSGDWFYPRVKMDASTSITVDEAQKAIDAAFNKTTHPYFMTLSEVTMPANRVTPTIYQRVWERTVINKLYDKQGGDLLSRPAPTYAGTSWTTPYNGLSTSYEKQEGTNNYAYSNALSVWVHPFSATDEDEKKEAPDGLYYTFRFPKEHTTYFYTNEKGELLSYSVNLKREHVGRFIYEDEESNASFPITMVYKNEGTDKDNNVFLVGNPFMSHINVEKFFDGNEHIHSIKVYDGTGNNSIIDLGKKDDNGILSATQNDVDAISSIAPMQSFFVETDGTSDLPEICEITYTEDMLEQNPYSDTDKDKGYLKSAQAATDEDRIYLTAMAAGKESSAVLRFSASASDYFRSGEDADILIDDEVPPAVAVFTVAGERAVDIQQRVNGGEIPLGFFLAKPEEVTLRFTVPRAYEGWLLNDAETGKSYPLRAGTNEFPLGRMLTNVGRFSLHGDSPTGNETITASQPRVYCFREEGNMLVVRSEAGMMARCEVYAPSGQLSGMARYETNEFRLPVAPGAKIVRVYFKDGVTSTIKTF